MALVTVDWKPTEQHLRGFGTACVAVFGGLAAWALWRHTLLGFALGPETAPRLALALGALAAACGLARLIAPRWLRPLYVGMIAASLPIGYAVSHLAIALVFFGVVTPIAVLFRVLRWDPLQRAFEPAAPTYWIRRRTDVSPARYYRQF